MIGRPIKIIVIPKRKAIIAYRWWDGLEKQGYGSTFRTSHYWHRKQPMTAHRVPQMRGVSGLYAHKTADRRKQYVYEGLYIGRVKLWGRVIVHEFGYRAQFGQIHGTVRRIPFKRSTFPNM